MYCHPKSKAYKKWLNLSDLRRKSKVKFCYKEIDIN